METRQSLENAVFVHCATQRLQELNFSLAAVFADVPDAEQLIAQPEPVTDLRSICRLFSRASELSRDDLFGFELAKQTDWREAGLLGYLSLCASDVGDFWEVLSEFTGLFGERLFFDTSELKDAGAITWGHRDLEDSDLAAQYHQFLAALLISTVRRATQRQIVLRQVAFTHAPVSNRTELDEFFGCKVIYHAPLNRLDFSPSDKTVALVTADPRLHRILKKSAIADLGTLGPKRMELPDQVRQRIAQRIGADNLSLEQVAADLGMSSRTLSRKLDDFGTSYFEILEALRLQMAQKYLSETNLNLARISNLLGYRSLSSFNDAFKRWTGHSPGRFRNKG